MGKEDELAKIHSDISKAVTARNKALSQHLPEYILMRKKRDLKTARVNMKKRLKQLGGDWWDKILDECQAANENVDMGSVYEILRQLGARDSKPNTGATITTIEFKEHFEKVSKDRYGADPAVLFRAVHKMTDNRDEAVTENEILKETPTNEE